MLHHTLHAYVAIGSKEIAISRNNMSQDITTPPKKKTRLNVLSDTKGLRRIQGGERYIIIRYAVMPEKLDWHREQCFLLYKGMKSDDDLKTFIVGHIRDLWPPPHVDIKQSTGEMMEATSYLETDDLYHDFNPSLTPPQKEILEEYDFSPSIYDHEKCSVRVRSVTPSCWYEIRSCIETHRETQSHSWPFIITYNCETGQSTDLQWVRNRHLWPTLSEAALRAGCR